MLANDIKAAQDALQQQEQIIDLPAERLDQFDAAYELLDSVTRANRKRITDLRDSTEKQHELVAIQIQGLQALRAEQKTK